MNTLENDLKIIGDATTTAVNALPPNYFRKQGGYAVKMAQLQSHKARLNQVTTPEFNEFVVDSKRLIDYTIRFLRTDKDKHRQQAVNQSDVIAEYFEELVAFASEGDPNGD